MPSSPLGQFLNFESYNVHGVNALLMLVELAFNKMYLHPAHLLFVLVWALTYIIVPWV